MTTHRAFGEPFTSSLLHYGPLTLLTIQCNTLLFFHIKNKITLLHCSKKKQKKKKSINKSINIYIHMHTSIYTHTYTSRLLPNRSPVAWGSQRISLGALIFDSNTFHFIFWAPKFSAFSSEGPFKIFLGSSLVHIHIHIHIHLYLVE